MIWIMSKVAFCLLQSCLPGYYRVDGILFGGICQPCECHGHATECDIHGVCFVSLFPKPRVPSPTLPKVICRAECFLKIASSIEDYPCPCRPQRKFSDFSSCHKMFPATAQHTLFLEKKKKRYFGENGKGICNFIAGLLLEQQIYFVRL